MQNGDLELWNRPRYVVVIEGVLCSVEPIVQPRRWRRGDEVVGHSAFWYDVPLKRLMYMKDRWPDTAQDLVTFVSEPFATQCGAFLESIGLQHDSLRYVRLDEFVTTLRFQRDTQSVYDSDPARLDRYGQLGHAVVPGEDI